MFKNLLLVFILVIAMAALFCHIHHVTKPVKVKKEPVRVNYTIEAPDNPDPMPEYRFTGEDSAKWAGI